MIFGSRIGWVSEFSCRAWLSSFDFHKNVKRPFSMLALEIFGSILTHDVRCASPLAVVQADPPRPWAHTTTVATRARTAADVARRSPLLIIISLPALPGLPGLHALHGRLFLSER